MGNIWRPRWDLRYEQMEAITEQCSRNSSFLWAFTGDGKTVITLTSIKHLLDHGYLNSVLIVATKRITQMVWRQEAAKWFHTKDLRFVLLAGQTKRNRMRALAYGKGDIYLITYDLIPWLARMYL